MFGRRIRGAITLGALWSAAWVLVLLPFTVSRWIEVRYHGFERPAPLWALPIFLLWPAVWGLVSGIGFGVTIVRFGRNSELNELRSSRLVIGGFLSGLVAPLFLESLFALRSELRGLLLPWLFVTAFSGAVNALLAYGSWRLMKRGTTHALDLRNSPVTR